MGVKFLSFDPQFTYTSVWMPPVEKTDPNTCRINPTLVDGDDLESGVPLIDPRTDTALARSYDELTGYLAPSTSWDATKSAWSSGGMPRLADRRSPRVSLAEQMVAPMWQIYAEGIGLITMVTLLACTTVAFRWPTWTGQTASRSSWVLRMPLLSWI